MAVPVDRPGWPGRWCTLIVASTLLAACGTDAQNADTPATVPNHSSPTLIEGTDRQMSRGAGGSPIVFTDVRVAEHRGFDRIVLEFSGAGGPGWAVEYVDDATLEGSGDVVTLGGDSVLNISASNTTWPASDYYSGPRRLSAENGGLTEVYVAGTFEGYTQVLAGIDGRRAPFRVSTRTHPSRLVIDVVVQDDR